MNSKIVYLILRVALITSLLWTIPPASVFAGGVVGDGTPASCTEAALDAALAGGGTITFNCGTAPHTILSSSAKAITLNTTIDGGGTITLDGQDGDRLFVVSNGAALILRNIVLTNGFSSGNGGAIYNGALGSDSFGSVTLENSTIRNSRSSQSGGAIVSTGPLTIVNSLLENNQALNGGALYPRFAGARTTIISGTLRYNQATDATNGWGGALLVWDGARVTIQDSDIFSNTATGGGGGIYAFTNSTLTLNGSTLRDNQDLGFFGGGIYNAGAAVLGYVTLSGNRAHYDGGGISNHGVMTVTQSTIYSNRAAGSGGVNNSGAMWLDYSTVDSNMAAKNGGGLANAGTLYISHSTISGNSAFNVGGGVWNPLGSLWAWNSTIDGNTASLDGAGIYNGGQVNLYNVTISHNVADYNDDGTGTGGGVYNYAGATFNTRNTLLVVNYRALPVAARLNDCSGEIWSDHSRFTSVPVNCSIVGPSSFTTDPNAIGPLADNGGPTLTVALLPGSDAIDAADPVQGCVNYNSVLPTDQRGAPRVAGAWCDVGAYEFDSLLSRLFLPLVIQ